MAVFYYDTAIGKLGIAEDRGSVTHVYFETDNVPEKAKIIETPILQEAAEQIRQYLSGERTAFSIPLAPEGTPFMKQVWMLLVEIPFGKTATYGEIALKAGTPKGARAVGLANNRNPIPIFIPCHRVIGANGKLTGYRGGLAVKKQLLELEGACRE